MQISDMKKICFVVYNTYSLFNPKTTIAFGGAELRSTIFAKELAKNKRYDVSFIIDNCNQLPVERYGNITLLADRYDYSKNGIQSPLNTLINKLYNYSVKVRHRLFHSKENYNAHLKYYCLNKVNADIYFIFGFTQESIHVAEFCKLKSKKYFHCLTSDADIPAKEKCSNEITETFKNKMNAASGIIVQNNFQKNQLERDFNIKAILLKNPIIIPDVITKCDNGENKKILWVGKSNSTKRPLLFLELAKLNPEQKFVMVCNRNDEKMHATMLLNMPENIEFYERLSFQETEKLFSNASIFVSTSLFEGFPNTFLQAGKYSLPLISTGVNPDKYITEYNCGYVCSDDISEMSEKLSMLFTDEKLRSQLGLHHFDYLSKNHSSTSIIQQLSKIIEST
jgi:glycosyltransferase involved in cell wall biosynthesis